MGRKMIFGSVLLLICFTLTIITAQGQPPAPPAEHGINGNQGAGGAAPVDGGVGILLLSGLGYGIRKMLRDKKVVKW